MSDPKRLRIYIFVNQQFLNFQGHEYAKNSYIATQGPLQNTIYDFWLMVLQNNLNFLDQHPPDSDISNPTGVQKVVMLTNFIENNRQKCEKYFPIELNEEITFHSPIYTESTSFFDNTEMFKNRFVIKNVGMVNKTGYTIRKLNVYYDTKLSASDAEDSEKCSEGASAVNTSDITVHHYWFHNWADHKCPKDVNALLNLSLDILKDTKYDFSETNDVAQDICKCESPKTDSKFLFPPLNTDRDKCEISIDVPIPSDFTLDQAPPIIIHCSAGIGRTGCLIAILNGIKQLTNEQKVDVLGIVCNMRLNRGGMVQNSEQYELIHKVLCLFERACLPEL